MALSCFISPELDFPVATLGTRASSPAYNSKLADSRMITNGISARIRDIQLGILTVVQIQDPQASVDLFIDAQVIRFASRTSSIVANNRRESRVGGERRSFRYFYSRNSWNVKDVILLSPGTGNFVNKAIAFDNSNGNPRPFCFRTFDLPPTTLLH